MRGLSVDGSGFRVEGGGLKVEGGGLRVERGKSRCHQARVREEICAPFDHLETYLRAIDVCITQL